MYGVTTAQGITLLKIKITNMYGSTTYTNMYGST
jgi:hypothetical protein